MTEEPRLIERHAATERFGNRALRTAHELTGALDDGTGPDEPVLFRRGGPHRSLQGLAALLDEVLEDEVLEDGVLDGDARPARFGTGAAGDGRGLTAPPTPGPPPSPIDPVPPPEPAPFPQPSPTDPTAPPPVPDPGPLT